MLIYYLFNFCPFKCEKPEFKEPSRIVKNMLSKLVFKCPFNCDKQINYDDLASHESKCISEKDRNSSKDKKSLQELSIENEILNKKLNEMAFENKLLKTELAQLKELNKNNENKDEVRKYELFETERWWLLLGWTKQRQINDPPNWCDIRYIEMSRERIILPINYEWIGEWEVERKDNSYATDSSGWEYSTDFYNNQWSGNKEKNYVRRRKWIKMAKIK